ncbi:type II secretion system minor pseudopilin GspI [uncultured Tateyamaria sp.]|uniref:type II secretion system minor pseudopilin GspI n=1 Tax=Tateyamaria sp. 1078 TaxID=3417464 RepID=UPI0026181600|nr:type II secretion system minor pseudopilin GspI [uncultured Tateyamaria sp.]
MNARAGGQAGFSLIETLVAMTVLAVSATAILSATETHTRTVTAVSDRTVAHLVAQNGWVELAATGDMATIVRMGTVDWALRADQSATKEPALARVDIRVARASEPEVILARLTGFLDTGEQVVR